MESHQDGGTSGAEQYMVRIETGSYILGRKGELNGSEENGRNDRRSKGWGDNRRGKSRSKTGGESDERVNVYRCETRQVQGDVFVQVNGVGYIISAERTKSSGKRFAEVLQNSQEQDSRTAELIDQETEKIRKWFEDADLNWTGCANTHPVLKKEEEMITIENRQMLIPREKR